MPKFGLRPFPQRAHNVFVHDSGTSLPRGVINRAVVGILKLTKSAPPSGASYNCDRQCGETDARADEESISFLWAGTV